MKKPRASVAKSSHKILVLDVGGTNIKLQATGQKQPRKIPSGPDMTAKDMVRDVKAVTRDWKYDRVSIGYPGPVTAGHPVREPVNLGCPVRIVNDAAMQALGSYHGGRMLFLGLGTGLGSAMIVDGILEPMELAHLPYKHGKTYEEYLGLRGLKRLGKKKWRKEVFKITEQLIGALQADYVVLGGGNAKKLKKLPPGARMGRNENAILGGFRLWAKE
jgi:polyphosphate glucokinase